MDSMTGIPVMQYTFKRSDQMTTIQSKSSEDVDGLTGEVQHVLDGEALLHLHILLVCHQFITDQTPLRNLLLQFRWDHQCAYNDMNYHIASRGLFHGGHVGFTPSWTQRTDKIRLPSYSPYQKTYM